MNSNATKLRVGIAAAAVAASLVSVAPAEAAPVVAPAAPVVLGPANVPLDANCFFFFCPGVSGASTGLVGLSEAIDNFTDFFFSFIPFFGPILDGFFDQLGPYGRSESSSAF
jgi:hypothetical protein